MRIICELSDNAAWKIVRRLIRKTMEHFVY